MASLSLGDRARLKTDVEFLINRVCQEFRKYDKYNRGLITAAGFSKVLSDLGLSYGQKEVSLIMEHCTITPQGFVLYKDLIKKCSPDTPRAKKSETQQFLLRAEQDEEGAELAGLMPDMHDTDNMKMYLTKQTEEIRKLYSRWDRGMLTDHAFVGAIERDLNIPLTEEFKHQMSVHGPSRTLNFSNLLVSLRIDHFLDKPGKNPRAGVDPKDLYTNAPEGRTYSSEDSNPQLYLHEQQNQLQQAFGPVRRNPINWGVTDRLYLGDENNRSDYIRNAIANFCDSKVGSWVFRNQLADAGVKITQDIDKLIRVHESDNSVHFGEFLACIKRNEARGDIVSPRSPRFSPADGGEFDKRDYEPQDPRFRAKLGLSESLHGVAGQDSDLNRMNGAGGIETAKEDVVVSNLPALKTPYATEYTIETELPRAQLRHHGEIAYWNVGKSKNKFGTSVVGNGSEEAALNAKKTDHKAAMNAGDIIAWRDANPQDFSKMFGASSHEHDILGGNADIITWKDSANDGSDRRSGKRVYKLSADEVRRPYGTEDDRYVSAEQAGTHEYRPAYTSSSAS